MGELTLSNGKTVTINTSEAEWGEWRAFFRSKMTDEEENVFIAKMSGISADEIDKMKRDDIRRIITAIIEVGSNPLADPN